GENGQEIFDPNARWLHQVRIVERRMHEARVNVSPPIAETVCVETAHVKALVAAPLQRGGGVVVAFNEKIDRFAAELRGVKTIKQYRPPAALRVPDFTREDRFTRGIGV